ncbi:MAG: SpoIIE family protein phosphatase [Chloroflexota bacterium]
MGHPKRHDLRSFLQSNISGSRNRRISITAKLRWSYVLSSTLPLILVGVLLLSSSARSQQNRIYEVHSNLANSAARATSIYVTELFRSLQNYTGDIQSDEVDLVAWERQAVGLQMQTYSDIFQVAVVDEQGQEIVRVFNQQAVRTDRLQNRNDDPAVQGALEGQVTFSDIAPNKDNLQTFTIAQPMLNEQGIVIGAVWAEVSVDRIMTELRLTTENVNSGRKAYLISSVDGTVLLDGGSAIHADGPRLSGLLGSETGTAEYVGISNEHVIGAIAPVSLLQNNTPVNWSIVVEQPSSVAFANVYRGILILMAVVILVGASTLIWSLRQARQIVLPLELFSRAARALGDGQLNQRIRPPANNELGDLALAFNQMADHVQQSQTEIALQNERLRRGLALARDIQVGLLPDDVPWSHNMIDVYARSIPAYEVGGDFYTFLALPEGRAAIAIGDISGKGIGAALLMALTSSTVESQGRQIEHPAKVLTTLNQLLAPRLRANHMNAALLFAVFDPQQRTVRVANAGMIAPVVITSEGNHFIDVGGLPVGAFAGAVYEEQTIQLQPNDALLLVSDGVVEAHNDQKELFGFERLEDVIATAPHGDVQILVEAVLEDLRGFMGRAEQHDDITLVAIRPTMQNERAIPSDNEEQTVTYAAL